MDLHYACAEFLNHCKVSKNLSSNTLRAYRTDLEEFQGFLGPSIAIQSVDRTHLRDFLRFLFDGRGLKESSIKRRVACLKVLFRWLELDEAIPLNPFHRMDARIRLPQRLPRTLTHGEVQTLLGMAAHRLGMQRLVDYRATRLRPALRHGSFGEAVALVALELLYATGVRVGELAAITLPDLNLVDGQIIVNGKGSRQRRVFLTDVRLVRLVQAYLDRRDRQHPGDDALLLTDSGTPATTHGIRQKVTETGRAAGLSRRVTPHMLRHSCATHLLEAGLDMRFVQKLLGHRSITTTEGYTSVSDVSLRAALDRLNSSRPPSHP